MKQHRPFTPMAGFLPIVRTGALLLFEESGEKERGPFVTVPSLFTAKT